VHKDDPEFGYRLLVDKTRDASEAMADRTADRVPAVRVRRASHWQATLNLPTTATRGSILARQGT
jgi:hypothetical protein